MEKMANHHDNNKKLVEQTLDRAIVQMFVRNKMGMADWDFNESLRLAMQDTDCLNNIKDLIKRYDETFDLAIKSNIQIDNKYKTLYKLK